MSASFVDVVFVVDASASMAPCFEGLAANLEKFLTSMQGFNFRIRLGLVAMNMGRSSSGGRLVSTTTLSGDLDSVYGAGSQNRLFTESAGEFLSVLRSVVPAGDENNLLSLDIALDFPFGPVEKTRRVVALFSDERIEDGAITKEELDRMPDIVRKVGDRRVMLFVAMPASDSLEILGTTDGCQIQTVDSGEGLRSLDFGKLMGQMAKSISVTSLQGNEGKYQRAIFGQDVFGSDSGSFEGMR